MNAPGVPVSETERTIITSLRQPVFLFGQQGHLLTSNQAAKSLVTKSGLTLKTLSDQSGALWRLLSHFSGSKTLQQPDLCVGNRNLDTLDTDPDDMPKEIFIIGTGDKYQACWNAYLLSSEKRLMLQLLNGTEQFHSLLRKQALQEALYQTSRTLSVGEMAAVLAHELNQPLGAIINYLGSALKRLNADMQTEAGRSRVQQALLRATNQAQQASAVIGRVREFVQSKEPVKTVCQPAKIIHRVIELMQLEIEKHQIKIALDISANLPKIHVDPVMLEQVMANLVRNAIDALNLQPPAERKMSICVSQSTDLKLIFSVHDNGPGVKAEAQDKLFAPFYTTKPNGMGAGLAICRSIIEFHGGRLYLEDSLADGPQESASGDNNHLKGACFVCVLPALTDTVYEDMARQQEDDPLREMEVSL